MLQLSLLPGEPKSNAIVSRFINDRLIKLMEYIIGDYVGTHFDDPGFSKVKSFEEFFETFVSIEELMSDKSFAEVIAFNFLPASFPRERANREFFGLYNLLKAKEEYVPDLTKEYILYHVIYNEVDNIEMNRPDDYDPDMEPEDDEFTTIQKIPEPDRTYVKNVLMKMYYGDCCTDDPEDDAEYMLNMYEDLAEYEECCFWDIDFMLLDDYTVDQIAASPFNKMLGITDPKGSNIIEFPVNGKEGAKNIKANVTISPWDLEDE